MPTKEIKQRYAHRYAWWVIGLLLLAGALALTGRMRLDNHQAVPADDTVWTLNVQINFHADGHGARVTLSPPWDTPHARLIGQKLSHPGLRLLRTRRGGEGGREIIALAHTAGNKALHAEFTIHVSPTDLTRAGAPVALSTERRERLLQDEPLLALESPYVTDTLEKLKAGAPVENYLVQRIFNYVRRQLSLDAQARDDDAASVLRNRRGSTVGRAQAMVALCRAAKLPARLVSGFILREQIEVLPHIWVEVHDGEQWRAYDPEHGYSGELPDNFIPLNRNGRPIYEVSQATRVQADYEISQQDVPVGVLGQAPRSPYQILDLTRLPLDIRTMLAILLLLPLGALLTAAIRTIVGIHSYGTFTPALIALAALYADWVAAAIIFLLVAIIGLLGRQALPDKLNRATRLTVVFTLVAMAMTLAVSVMDYFDFSPAGHVVLLPIVILTSLIDRIYRAVDEDGVHIALRRLVWTLGIAFFCFLILQLEALGHWLLRYPEAHLFTMAGVVLLSLYSGKKLCDYPMFRWLAEPKKTRRKTKNDASTQDAEPSKDGTA